MWNQGISSVARKNIFGICCFDLERTALPGFRLSQWLQKGVLRNAFPTEEISNAFPLGAGTLPSLAHGNRET